MIFVVRGDDSFKEKCAKTDRKTSPNRDLHVGWIGGRILVAFGTILATILGDKIEKNGMPGRC